MSVNIDLAFTNSVEVRTSSEPYFLTDTGIEGCITLSDPLKIGFDLVKISLEGVLLNSVRSTIQNQDARKLQIILRMSDIKKRSDLVHIIQRGRTTWKYSFRFHVPQCLGRNLLGEDAEYLSDLPASLSCSETFRFGPNQSQYTLIESQVFYLIRTDVIRREINVGTVMRTIQILPSLKPRPPICITDFGNEYTIQCTKALRGRGRWSLNKIGRCTVEAEEPQAIILNQPNGPFTVLIPLRIMSEVSSKSTRGKHDHARVQQSSKCILHEDFDCTSTLVSSTYISTVPLHKTPTQAEANRFTSITRSSSVCSKTTDPVTSPRSWTYHASLGCWESRTIATLKFDSFKTSEPILPSFDSSMISRRYKIVLKIQINTPTRLTFVLDIPVTIRYSSQQNDDPPPFEVIPNRTDIQLDESDGDSNSDRDRQGSNLSSSRADEDLEQQFASLGLRGFLLRQDQLYLADMDLPAYHPRTVGIASPPYVM